jgi:hypothetical protein
MYILHSYAEKVLPPSSVTVTKSEREREREIFKNEYTTYS